MRFQIYDADEIEAFIDRQQKLESCCRKSVSGPGDSL